ncbi:MAG: hypothetical protein J6Q41_02290 [Firmicutes bacterium]|nr:hypothetical protein [Bacillota bacterium]
MENTKKTKNSRRTGFIIILILLLVAITLAVTVIYRNAEAKKAAEEAAIQEEINNRPVVNVLDWVDVTPAIFGYDGLAYVDKREIVYDQPTDIVEILKTSKNYDEEADYSGRQAQWAQVLRDLKYTVSPDTSEGGSLSNGDKVTVTATLPEHNLEALEEELHIKIQGIDESRDFIVEGLPYKYDSPNQTVSEKSGFIQTAVNALNAQAASEFDSSKGDYSSFKVDGTYLAKPVTRPDLNPDALLILGHVDQDADTEYPSTHTAALYVLPFDCNVQVSDLDVINSYEAENGILVKVEYFNYHTPEQVLKSFSKGIYFAADTAYEMVQLN